MTARSRRTAFGAGALFSLLALAALGFWWAHPQTPADQTMMVSNPSCACAKTPGDTYDPAWSLNFGTYRGSCIDNCKYRSLIVLSKSDQEVTIANVLHQEEYWTARVPIDSISESEVLFQNFTSMINHVALGFHTFRRTGSHPEDLAAAGVDSASAHAGILLTPQSGDLQRRVRVPGLVISAEGAPPSGKPYGLMDGLLGRYAMTFRAASLPSYRQESAALGFPLKRFDTDLDAHESRRLFKLALETSANESFKTVYQLFYNNCATTAIDLMVMARNPNHRRLFGLREILDLERGIPATFNWGTLRRMRAERLLGSEIPGAPAKAGVGAP